MPSELVIPSALMFIQAWHSTSVGTLLENSPYILVTLPLLLQSKLRNLTHVKTYPKNWSYRPLKFQYFSPSLYWVAAGDV